MTDTAINITADPSVRQAEFLNYVPAIMSYAEELNKPDIAAVEKAVAYFVKRHESVRTIFPLVDGVVKQVILPYDRVKFGIEIIDATVATPSEEEIKSQCLKKTEKQFANKKKGPLVKFFLFKQHGQKYTFLLLIDHIVCDAWSMAKIIKEEIPRFYMDYMSGREPSLPPLKMQLREYCERQKQWLHVNREALGSFWKEKLTGYDDRYDINSFYNRFFLRNGQLSGKNNSFPVKTDKQFTKLYTHQRSGLYTFQVTHPEFTRLKELVDANKCTMSSVIYASWYIFLYCYTGRNKQLIAAFIADRFVPAYRSIIGLLIGTVYFPEEISDDMVVNDFISKTLYDVLANCEKIIFSHEYLGLDEKKLNLAFDLLINYIKINNAAPHIPELEQQHLSILGTPYVLEAMVHEYDDCLVFYWKYKPLFDSNLIEDMVACYKNILGFIAENGNKTIGEVKEYFLQPVA